MSNVLFVLGLLAFGIYVCWRFERASMRVDKIIREEVRRAESEADNLRE